MTLVPSATSTEAITPMDLLPTKTTEPTILPVETNIPDSQPACTTLETKRPEEVDLSGKLVLIKDNPGNYLIPRLTGELILQDLETGENLELTAPDQIVGNAITSPDGKWLAYVPEKAEEDGDLSNAHLIVVDANGEQNADIPYQEAWWYPSRWMDNDRVIFWRSAENLYEAYTPVTILNPFTGDLQNLPDNPQDLWSYGEIISFQDVGLVSYDPSLRYRVYYSNNDQLILEDTHENSILFQVTATYSSAPIWAPDGTGFVFANSKDFPVDGSDHDELYYSDLNGNIEPITDFLSQYSRSLINNPTWSPDGRKIAFWVSLESNKSSLSNLAFLDLKNGSLTLTCEKGYLIGSDPTFFPHWSADSRYLLLGTSTKVGEGPDIVSIMDIEDLWITQVAEDLSPVGWLTP